MLITRDAISLDRFLTPAPSSCGGTVFFAGRVRDHHESRRVLCLEYHCYEAMAEKQMRKILEEIRVRCGVEILRALHRVGRLEIGETAVVIEAHSAHRAEAFRACRLAIDEIKSKVPIWKKEFYADGSSAWPSCVHAVDHEASSL